MLDRRRVLEFSSRVHTYLLSLSFFLFLLLILALNIRVEESFFTLLSYFIRVLSWTFVLEGAWIVIYSIYLSFATRVLSLKPLFLTILRSLCFFALLFLSDSLLLLMDEGLTIGGGIF